MVMVWEKYINNAYVFGVLAVSYSRILDIQRSIARTVIKVKDENKVCEG